VLAGALLLVFAWVAIDEPASASFYRAMSVLVAASPCALASATPAVVLSGVARAGRAGVLILGQLIRIPGGIVGSVGLVRIGIWGPETGSGSTARRSRRDCARAAVIVRPGSATPCGRARAASRRDPVNP
jgi:hypothetical protein